MEWKNNSIGCRCHRTLLLHVKAKQGKGKGEKRQKNKNGEGRGRWLRNPNHLASRPTISGYGSFKSLSSLLSPFYFSLLRLRYPTLFTSFCASLRYIRPYYLPFLPREPTLSRGTTFYATQTVFQFETVMRRNFAILLLSEPSEIGTRTFHVQGERT